MPEHFSDWNEEMVSRHDPELFHHHPRAVVRWIEGRRVKTVLGLLQAHPGHRVLEVGCGGGNVLGRALGAERHGIDLSRRMAWRAQATLKGLARIARADAEALPYRHETFDRVLCTSVLAHVRHPERVLEEAYRVLKPGGRLVVSVSHEAAIERGIRLAEKLRLDHLLLGNRRSPPGADVYSSEYHLHHFNLALLREAAAKLPPERMLRKVTLVWYPIHLVAVYDKAQP